MKVKISLKAIKNQAKPNSTITTATTIALNHLVNLLEERENVKQRERKEKESVKQKDADNLYFHFLP